MVGGIDLVGSVLETKSSNLKVIMKIFDLPRSRKYQNIYYFERCIKLFKVTLR